MAAGVGMMDQSGGHPVVFAVAADLQRLPEGVGNHAGVQGIKKLAEGSPEALHLLSQPGHLICPSAISSRARISYQTLYLITTRAL